MNLTVLTDEQLENLKNEITKAVLNGLNEGKKQLKIMKSEDVRKLFGISDSTLFTWRTNRTIPYSEWNGSYFYNMDEIMELFEQRKIAIKTDF
jgi:hypothetical protein